MIDTLFKKCHAVIKSCKTPSHLHVARNYCNLAIKRLEQNKTVENEKYINLVIKTILWRLKQQRKIIYLI